MEHYELSSASSTTGFSAVSQSQVNAHNTYGNTPIQVAIQAGDVEQARTIQDMEGFDASANVVNKNGVSLSTFLGISRERSDREMSGLIHDTVYNHASLRALQSATKGDERLAELGKTLARFDDSLDKHPPIQEVLSTIRTGDVAAGLKDAAEAGKGPETLKAIVANNSQVSELETIAKTVSANGQKPSAAASISADTLAM